MSRPFVSRFIATLVSVFCTSSPAFALETPHNPVASYATALRDISPHISYGLSRSYAKSVLANAARTHVDPRIIMAVVTVESDWYANAVSGVGAQGLGQLMPGTAAELQVNPHDAADNLRGTAKYLRTLFARFRGQHNTIMKAIAGYNAGPNAVAAYGGVPPYPETQHYVTSVLHVYQQLNSRVGVAWTPYSSHPFLHRRAPAESIFSRAMHAIRALFHSATPLDPVAMP